MSVTAILSSSLLGDMHEYERRIYVRPRDASLTELGFVYSTELNPPQATGIHAPVHPR
jgi:hypothetical protein